MKTQFEKLFKKHAAPYRKKLKEAEFEYQKFLKSFIQNTLTGRAGFKEAYEIGEDYFHDFLHLDGGLPKELYPKHKVMEHFIQVEIIRFEDMLEEDPIGNKGL
jgi:hypothetical protein